MDQNKRFKLVLSKSRHHIKLPYIKYGTVLLALVLFNMFALNAYTRTSDEDLNQASNGAEAMQGISITGKITDASGNALPGVNVVEKGTTNGTITDTDGNYSITVAGSASILAFSFVGYIAEEVTVGNQTVIDIAMVEDIIGLSEIVVVGYGTQRKSDVTGSLSSVSEEQIKDMPVTNINQALQGRAAGVDVVNTSYGLNRQPQVRIRGNRSIYARNDPLYVVDGVPITGNINDLNAGDIESVEILKDASATAIYGSRGASGVILITTKRGQSGQMHANLESSVSFTNALRFFDQLTGDEWMDIARNNYRASSGYSTPYPNPYDDYAIVQGFTPTAWDNVALGYVWEDQSSPNPLEWVVQTRPVTAEERARWEQVMDDVPDEVPVYNPGDVQAYDWFSEGRNANAMTQNHQFSVSGGTEKISAYFSIGYIDQQGQGVGERFQRINPRLNMDIKPFDWLKVGMSTTFSSQLTDPGEGLLWGVTSMIPITTPYDSAGEFQLTPTNDTRVKNPLRDEELNTRENRLYRYLGAYYAEISFTKHLRYRLNVSQDFRQYRNGKFIHELASEVWPSTNYGNYVQGQEFHYSVDNLLFYNRDFGPHSIGVTLLQSIEARRMERTSMNAENLPYDTQLWYQLNSTNDPSTITIDDGFRDTDSEYGYLYSRWQLASFMGRINYGLMDKYLLTASLRYDGSSLFYVDNQWDYFPSVAVAWKIHNENFMQNQSIVSLLKLRAGFGTVGQAGNHPYETAGRIAESQYVFGEDPAKGYAPSAIQTKEVGWEKTSTTNLGLDFGILDNRLSGSIELYRANTNDLLLDKTIPAVTGYTSVRANVGKTRNQGIEITLTSYNIDRGDFRWESNLTFTHNKEEILELAEGAQDDVASGWFIGEPLHSYYTYVYDGIWQLADSTEMAFYNSTGTNGFEAGKIRVKDVDGNDTINSADQIVVGSSVPKFSGGFTNRFSYKGFEFSFFLFFRVGAGIYSRDGHYFPMSARYATPFLTNYYLPMGTPEENADADHPAPSNLRDRYESAMWYREASFMKVRNITLSYNVPKSVLQRVKINSLLLSVQAFNPFLFTDYPYLDPEAHNDANDKVVPGGTSGKGWTFTLKMGL